MRHHYYNILVALGFLLLPTFGFGGDGREGGNGGDVVFCPNGHPKAELMDLFEGRELYGLTIASYNKRAESAEDLAREMLFKIESVDPTYFEYVVNAFNRMLPFRRFLKSTLVLTPIQDSLHPVVPRHCQVKQLANFNEAIGILIDQDYWRLLDKTSRAALYVHEAVYALERSLSDAENSIITRRIVAYLFSTEPLNTQSWADLRRLFKWNMHNLNQETEEYHRFFSHERYHKISSELREN